MERPSPYSCHRSGFTLLEISIVLVIIAVVVGGGMTMFSSSLQRKQEDATKAKQQRIQAALYNYRVTYNRLPCPADATIVSTAANFGTEAATAGTCTGGTPTANFWGGGNAEGMVPTKTLKLSDDDAFDGWGRRIMYAVDQGYTASNAFTANDMCTPGRLTIRDAASSVKGWGVYALISFGRDGHGAYPRSGGSARISVGSVNADALNNCDCNSNAAATGFDGTFIQKMSTENPGNVLDVFDDKVAYSNRTNLISPGDLGCGCTLLANQGGGKLAHGGTRTEYASSSDGTCTANTLTCSNGTLSCSTGNMSGCQYASCSGSCSLSTNQGGGTMVSGSTRTEYAASSGTCTASTLTCTTGTLSCSTGNMADCQYARCGSYCSLSGNQGGGSLATGNSSTEYASGSDATCTAHTLTCTGGTLSCSTGDLNDCQYASCSPACSLSSNQGGGLLASGSTRTEYASTTGACTANTMTCTGGTLSCSTGNMSGCQFAGCGPYCSLSTNQGGGMLATGNSRTEYVSSSDATCAAKTLSCTNGTLSCSTGNINDCQYASCGLACSPSANQGGGTLGSGGTRNEYTSVAGTCTVRTMTCTNGILSCSTGDMTDCQYASCTIPGGSGSTYLAVAHNTSPYVTIYKRSGDTFTKLANPATLPTGSGKSVTFSSDDTYLAVAHTTSPFVTVYKRSGDTFTKLADPATLPASNGNGVAFSSDSTYLAVGHDLSPFVTVFKRSGDIFTKLADPATLPPGNGNGVAFSPDTTYLAVATDTSPYVTIYKRSGDTFTKLADPATLPPNNGKWDAFSSDNTYLAVSHNGSPYVTIYKRSGDTFTKLANPATLPAGSGFGTDFSSDVTYLAVAHGTTPFVTVYKRSGDIFTKLADPATLPASTGDGVIFSPDTIYLAVAHASSPRITIYKRSGDTFTKLADPATLPTGTGNGAAFSHQ